MCLNVYKYIYYIYIYICTTNSTELQRCIDTIHNWLTSNHLQLNATKTELLNINANLDINSNLDNFPILYIDSSPLTSSSTVT